MSNARIYSLTSIGRPLDPGCLSNRAVLFLTPLAGLVLAVLSQLAIAGTRGPVSAGIAGALIAFGSWALVRELAPDDNPAAFVAMAFALVALLLFDPGSVIPLFVALFLVRIVNRSTGLAPTRLDSAMVALLASWATFGLGQPLLGLVAAAAFVFDAMLRGGRREQWLPALVCGIASAVALVGDGAVGAPPSMTGVHIGFLLVVTTLYIAAILAVPRPTSVGDATGEPLDQTRVRAGMLIGALVVAQSAAGRESGFDVLGAACLFAVGLSTVGLWLLRLLGWRPASVPALISAYSLLITAPVIASLVALHVPDPGAGAPRIIVSVDNSLWNRLGLNRLTYVRRLRQQGLHPVIVRFDETGAGDEAAALMHDVSGLLLTGGGDVEAVRYSGDASVATNVKPRRDAFEIALLAEAERRSLPVLGLCRGAQVLNVYLGGTLGAFRDQPARFRKHMRHFAGHAVTIDAGSRLAGIFDDQLVQQVTTLHGQFVAREGRGVRIVARAKDGTPEAIEVGSGPGFGMLGVQWHAEVPPWDVHQRPLFDAFGRAVTKASH